MKLACSTVCCSHLDIKETLEKIASIGFENLELLAIKGWVHVDVEKVPSEEIRKMYLEHGLNLIALHAGGLDASNNKTLASSLLYIQSVIDCAEKLKVNKVVFTGGNRVEGALDRYIQGLEKLMQYIQGKNIYLCIENHYRNQVETVTDMERIVKKIDSPYLGLTIDTGHFTSSHIPLQEVIDQLGPWIKHVHIKDHIGTQSVGLGRGETDNVGFVSELRRIGYEGYLSMELEVEDKENIDLYLKEGFEYMKKLVSI